MMEIPNASNNYIFNTKIRHLNNMSNPKFYGIPEKTANAQLHDEYDTIASNIINILQDQVINMKEKEKILNTLIDLYVQLYNYKDMLSCKKLFKYDIDVVENLLDSFDIDKSTIRTTTKKTKSKKSNIPDMNKLEEVQKYYYENMIYDRNDTKEKAKLLKKYTKDELCVIYKIIFNQNSNSKKEIIFDKIQLFFDDIERSKNI